MNDNVQGEYNLKETPKKFFGWIAFLLVVVLCLVSYFITKEFLNYNRDKESTTTEQPKKDRLVREGIQATDARHFEEAEQYLQSALDEIGVGVDDELLKDKRTHAKFALAYNLYNQRHTEGGLEKQAEAIKLNKEIVTDSESSPRWKAHAISALLGYYYNNRELSVFEDIFSTEPYSTFLMEENGDQSAALRRLAEYADTFYPIATNKLRIARWYSGQLLSNDELTDPERIEYKERVLTLLREGEELFPSENVWRARAITSFHHHRGFNWAVLSIDNREFFENASSAFEEVYSFYLNREYSFQDSGTLVAQLVPFTHFYHAAFLNRIFGAEASEEIDQHVVELVSIVDSDYRPELNEFRHAMMEEYDRLINPDRVSDYNADLILELASVNVRFKSFLVFVGWDESVFGNDQ